jgi:hypothetical protein
MSNHTERNQGSAPGPRTIFDYAAEGETFDQLPEELRQDVRRADKDKDARDALTEIRADQLFATAANVLLDLMQGDDGKLALGAACEVFRFRAVTLKSNKKRQTAESVAAKIADGFKF